MATRCTSPRCRHLVRATDGHLDGAEWVCNQDGLPAEVTTTASGVRLAQKDKCEGKET